LNFLKLTITDELVNVLDNITQQDLKPEKKKDYENILETRIAQLGDAPESLELKEWKCFLSRVNVVEFCEEDDEVTLNVKNIMLMMYNMVDIDIGILGKCLFSC
jgi:hypothetical protein